MKQARKLELCLLNYFLLITIAAIMIGVEFYFEMSRPGLKQDICTALTSITEITETIPLEKSSPVISNLRNKVAIMFGVLTFVVAIVMLMFVKNITRPLQRTLDTARLINEGDLSQVIAVEAYDEVGQLGIVINELTSNFQEIASSTLAMINVIEHKIDVLSTLIPENSSSSAAQISQIKQEIDALHSFIDTFNLLQTDITE